MFSILPLALVVLLSLVQYFSSVINIERSKYRDQIASFAAAIAITYLLISFLPKAYIYSNRPVAIIPLIAGFAAIHLLEKYFYQKYSARFSIKKATTAHDEIHATVLFVYHFVIGAVLIRVIERSPISGLLFLIPLVMFTTIGNWSLHHSYLQKMRARRILLSSSTILGAVFSVSIFASNVAEHIMINFAAGFLLFIIVRESLPSPKKGNPLIFILGVIFYTIVILLMGDYATPTL